MSAYRRDLDETRYFSFSKKKDKLLAKDNEIWGKVSNSVKNGLIVNLYTMKNIWKLK